MTNDTAQSGRRAAASWVAGTGAFLLLAAAGLFVAVNWDRIPPNAKLGVVVGLTITCIGSGLKLRSTLPATGNVLLHLGALLIPVDVAAVGLHRQLEWEQLVLAEGAVCSGAFLALAEMCRTKLMTWLSWAAVGVAAVGVHLTSDLPAGVVLAAAAMCAVALRRNDAAVWWSLGAGAVPLFADGPWPLVVGAGLVAAVVLGTEAERRRDLSLGFAAIAAFGIGAVSGWAESSLPQDADIVGLAGAFLGLQLLAMAVQADPFWGKPARWITGVAEGVTATIAVPGAVLTVLLGLGGFTGESSVYVSSLLLVGLGWMVAGARRGDALGPFTLLAAPVFAAAAVFTDIESIVVAGSLAAAALLAAAARLHWDDAIAPVHTVLATGLVLTGSISGLDVLHEGGVVVLMLTMLWGIANLVDQRAGAFPRLACIVPLAGAVWTLPHEGAIAVGLLAAMLFAVDAVRLDVPEFGIGSALAMQVVVGSLAASAGLALPDVGLAMAVSGLVWAGFSAVAEERWRTPFFAAAGLGVGIGLAFAWQDPRALSDVVVVAGALLVAIGLVHRNDIVGHLGGMAMIIGICSHLGAVDVTVAEAYAAPVAAHLLIAGLRSRAGDYHVSSWWAYAPPVAVMGLVSLSERMGGGESWHALAAGAAGLLGVAIGGWYRQAGPLFTGTALLVAVAVHESLGTLAGTPTWAWLAAGGTTLLSVGIALERSDQSPVEVGRRLVDVMHERFD